MNSNSMTLISARVQNFRSAEDTGTFSLEHLTCLVGKNEAGKTAVLQALAGINSHPATPLTYELERDYPKRFLARYKEIHEGKEAIVTTSEWQLPESALQAIKAEFGEGTVTDDRVTIKRSFNTDGLHWQLPIIEQKAITHLIATANFSAPEKAQVGAPTTSQALATKLKELEANAKHKALLEVISNYPSTSILSRVREICEPTLPQFMYFSNYDRMSAAVHLPTLSAQVKDKSIFSNYDLRGDRLFWEFLEFSGVPLANILNAATFESFNARLQAASNVLTEEILAYWTQNQDIEIRVNVAEGRPGDPPPFNSGPVGRARIYNMLHKADTSFSERSAGFTWFFSFLIKFDRVKKEAKGPVFLLLDEPGLSLHGLAQEDLLRFFREKLSPHHQIIYSTHSPFMVPADNLMASRIVEDLVSVDNRGRRTPIGTKVREDVLGASRDATFPLQGALGYSLTQTLFVGKHTLLVEGPGDILYLKALSAELARRKRTVLDPRWVICPSGGIDKIHSFVSLFGGNQLDVVALTDFAKKDQKKLENLRKSGMLRDGALLSIADFVAQEEADVEDLLEPPFFCQVVNSAYGLGGKSALDEQKLSEADSNTRRLVKKAEAYFRTLPETIPMFDHFTPASWLLSNPAILGTSDDAVLKTLDRAEELFKILNAAMKAD
jgi:predicted ATP-dependent endonuclease of OLD family